MRAPRCSPPFLTSSESRPHRCSRPSAPRKNGDTPITSLATCFALRGHVRGAAALAHAQKTWLSRISHATLRQGSRLPRDLPFTTARRPRSSATRTRTHQPCFIPAPSLPCSSTSRSVCACARACALPFPISRFCVVHPRMRFCACARARCSLPPRWLVEDAHGK